MVSPNQMIPFSHDFYINLLELTYALESIETSMFFHSLLLSSFQLFYPIQSSSPIQSNLIIWKREYFRALDAKSQKLPLELSL